MGKSIDPMWKEKAGSGSGAHSRRSSASISLQPVIPWRVALQQSPPPLHRPTSECDKVVLPVNQFGDKGNPVAPVNFNRPPESPVAKQRTELSLKKNEKLSEQPGPVQLAIIEIHDGQVKLLLLLFDCRGISPQLQLR